MTDTPAREASAAPDRFVEFAGTCRFLDIETTEAGGVRTIGAVLGDREFARPEGTGNVRDVRRALEDLDAFARGARTVVGHNLIGHDVPHLRAAWPALRLLTLPAIDTLVLSPLAFPRRPYHQLVKDYKLVRDEKSHALADARLAKRLLACPTAPDRWPRCSARSIACASPFAGPSSRTSPRWRASTGNSMRSAPGATSAGVPCRRAAGANVMTPLLHVREIALALDRVRDVGGACVTAASLRESLALPHDGVPPQDPWTALVARALDEWAQEIGDEDVGGVGEGAVESEGPSTDRTGGVDALSAPASSFLEFRACSRSSAAIAPSPPTASATACTTTRGRSRSSRSSPARA